MTHKDLARLLRLYSLGHDLTSLARGAGKSPVELEEAFVATFGQEAYQAASLSNVEAGLDDVLTDLDKCVDKEDAVRLSSLKAKSELLRWKAEKTTSRYRPKPSGIRVDSGAAVLFQFVAIGDTTAKLRSPEPKVINGVDA